MAQMLSNLPDGQDQGPKSLQWLKGALQGTQSYPLGLPMGANFAVPNASQPMQTVFSGYMNPDGSTANEGQAAPMNRKSLAAAMASPAMQPAGAPSLDGLDNGGSELPASTGGGAGAGTNVSALLQPLKRRGQPPSGGPAPTVGSF